MSDVIIGATLQVDAGSSNAVVKELNQNTTELKTNLKDVGTTAVKTGEDIKSTTGNFGKLKDGMASLPGPLGQAGEGVNKLNTAFKSLLANPVGLIILAIVAALALLYKAFTNTFEGGQKMEQVFAGIKAAGQALLDSLGKIASSIVKIFSFDFSGAIEDMKEVGEAAADAYNKMADLTKEAQELHKEQLANDLDAAEREKKLAILREQATDESVPIAKRKALLKELQAATEKNAIDDIDLAKRTADNFIAQKTLEKDGALKNQDEINEAKIKAIRVETENANELRRVNKQILQAEKQEQQEKEAAAKEAAERAKEARQKAIAEAKEAAQKLFEFETNLRKLRQENELAQIKDGYEKEKQALEFKIADEKAANEKAFKDKKLTRDQFNAIQAELDEKANLERQAVTDKHNDEITKKEDAFQKQLASIQLKIRLDAITDSRQKELAELEVAQEQQLAKAAEDYKNDAAKLFEIKAAIDEQFRQQKTKIEEKNALEDAKKAFDNAIGKNKDIINDPDSDIETKRAALAEDVKLNQEAYDAKTITEDQYLAHKKENDAAEEQIDKTAAGRKKQLISEIGNALGNLANIVGKQTAAGKALAIAQTTIDTFQSAIASYKSLANIPYVGPILGGIAAAAAVASGIAAVKKITAVQVPGGGGGGSVPTGLPIPAAPIAPTQLGTTIDQNSIRGIGDATSGRVYVLDSDIQNSQERATRLNRSARLGG